MAGKLLDAPVYTLLGGPLRTDLPACASGISGTTADERVGAAALAFVADGPTAVEASIGRGDVETDLAGVAALAEAVRGMADLLVDAHGAYTAESALHAGCPLQDMGVYWLEDPLRVPCRSAKFDALRRVQSGRPLDRRMPSK